jgi:hypothetical protein
VDGLLADRKPGVLPETGSPSIGSDPPNSLLLRARCYLESSRSTFFRLTPTFLTARFTAVLTCRSSSPHSVLHASARLRHGRDDWAAIAEAYEIARELMRNAAPSMRLCCISVRDETGASLFEVPLVAVDERLDVRFPESKALIERACELRRKVREARYALRKTRRHSAALIARSRGENWSPSLSGMGTCSATIKSRGSATINIGRQQRQTNLRLHRGFRLSRLVLRP